MNYQMNKIDSTLPKLLNILVITEDIFKSLRGTVLIMAQASSKRKSSFKKKKPVKKQKNEVKPKK